MRFCPAFEFGPVLQTEVGRLQLNGNLIFDRPLGAARGGVGQNLEAGDAAVIPFLRRRHFARFGHGVNRELDRRLIDGGLLGGEVGGGGKRENKPVG